MGCAGWREGEGGGGRGASYGIPVSALGALTPTLDNNPPHPVTPTALATSVLMVSAGGGAGAAEKEVSLEEAALGLYSPPQGSLTFQGAVGSSCEGCNGPGPQGGSEDSELIR